MPTSVDTDRVRRLLDDGAQVVDVLPGEIYLQEHIQGAVSVPLDEIDQARERLDPARPVVVDCYDYQ